MSERQSVWPAWAEVDVILDIIDYTRVYIAVGVTVISLGIALIFGQSLSWRELGVVFFATFGVYAVNRWTDIEEDSINNTAARQRRAVVMLWIGVVSLVVATALAAASSFVAVLGIGWIAVCIICYSVPLRPESARYQRAKEVPFLKNLTVAVGLSGLVFSVVVGGTNLRIQPGVSALFLFVNGRIIIGSIIPDIRDMDGDTAAGVRTLPVVLGISRTKQLLALGNALLLILLFGSIASGIIPVVAAPVGVSVVLSFVLIYLIRVENAQQIALMYDVIDTYGFVLLVVLGRSFL